jgi:prepilin-type N-terminal cleavage/methylation domain-containing protein
MKYVSHHERGFTLIELLVVFSIIAIISTVTLASFSDFNKASAVKQTGAQLASFFNDAKSRSLSQLKPSSCAGSLGGYVVDICITAGAGCTNADSYKMSVVCSGVKTALVPPLVKRLPTNMHFSSSGTTSTSYQFNILTGGVTGAGSVAITGGGSTITLSVSSVGSISYE